MPTLKFTTVVDAPLEVVWEFHARLDGLTAITPPTTRVRIIDPPARLGAGVRFTMMVRQPPIPIALPWETIITVFEPPVRFVDEQGRGPFALWQHEHRFEAVDAGHTRITDSVEYRVPFGPLGRLADRLFVRRQLDALFAYRRQATVAALSTVSAPGRTAIDRGVSP
jgi:ligand-binding SRPBCC domain-containing protein